MNVVFQDLEDATSPLNGASVGNRAPARELFGCLGRMLRFRQPFGIQMVGDDGSMLTIGIASDVGAVQHGTADGFYPT